MRRKKPLGAPTDNPRAIMAGAFDELESRAFLAKRQAAEKAHLALTSAVEVATHRAITSHKEELRAVEEIAKRVKDPHFARDYRAVRKYLHGDCFHQDKCGTDGKVFSYMADARTLMERILRSKAPRRAKR